MQGLKSKGIIKTEPSNIVSVVDVTFRAASIALQNSAIACEFVIFNDDK